MATYSEERQIFLEAKIAELMVMKPSISEQEIEDQMRANGYNIGRKYIKTCQKKFFKRMAVVADRFFLNLRIGQEARAREMALVKAWNIVNTSGDNYEVLGALRLILDEERSWTTRLLILQVLRKEDPRLQTIMPTQIE
jgi:hypothetical protein